MSGAASQKQAAPAAPVTTAVASQQEWSLKEREFAAGREKVKGNEALRAGEVDKAIAHYSRSLDLVPGNAIVLANRYIHIQVSCL